MVKVIQLEEVDSTNSYGKKHIDEFEDKIAIITKKQTSGRGRLNRSWVDLGEENLFLSIILKPSETFNEIYPNLTQYLSVTLCKVIESYGIQTQIKWPNDVLIDGKKIAGILSETVMQGQKLKGIVLGVGVNLNSSQEKIDAIPNKIATSLNIETQKAIDLKEFLNKLLTEFFEHYDEFLQSGFLQIKDDYIKRNCFLGKELKVQVFNHMESGLAKAVNDLGELVLEDNNKREIVLTIGDIIWTI